MGSEGIFQRLSAVGAAAQASVPGVYAWGVTVAPAAWARGASALAKVAAISAIAALLGGVVGERLVGGKVRVVSFWGFVLACALAWSAAPTALAPLRIDAPRGAAGMIGWALFALASAAPALQGRREKERRRGRRGPRATQRSGSRGSGLRTDGGHPRCVSPAHRLARRKRRTFPTRTIRGSCRGPGRHRGRDGHLSRTALVPSATVAVETAPQGNDYARRSRAPWSQRHPFRRAGLISSP